MRFGLVWVVSAVAVLAMSVTALANISTSTQPSVFAIQGKVLRVGKGWVQVQVTQVRKGSAVRARMTLRILETARTKYLRKGQSASGKDLKSGEMVQITGSIVGNGKTLTDQADGVTILQ